MFAYIDWISQQVVEVYEEREHGWVNDHHQPASSRAIAALATITPGAIWRSVMTNLRRNCEVAQRLFSLTEQDVVFGGLPLFHVFGHSLSPLFHADSRHRFPHCSQLACELHRPGLRGCAAAASCLRSRLPNRSHGVVVSGPAAVPGGAVGHAAPGQIRVDGQL